MTVTVFFSFSGKWLNAALAKNGFTVCVKKSQLLSLWTRTQSGLARHTDPVELVMWVHFKAQPSTGVDRCFHGLQIE